MTSDAARAMRADYLWSHHRCAYCQTVPKSEYPHCDNEGFDLEHIWARGGGRLDDPNNYVICCRESHEWKHRNLTCGRIAAMYWKWKHGEFDRERLRSLIGMDPIGWVENRLADGLPEWAAKLAEELIKANS